MPTKRARQDTKQMARQAQRRLVRGDVVGAIALLGEAASLAEREGALLELANLLNRLELMQKHAGQVRAAQRTSRKVVKLLRDALAQALNNAGFIERDLGYLDAARQQHLEALGLCDASGDPIGTARTLINL